jgi:hypothetical protein
MTSRLGVLLIANLSAVALSTPRAVPVTPSTAGRELVPVELPGSAVPVVQTHTYRMSGRVRALLLWVGRENVGSGIIRWRGGPSGNSDAGYELLIGTDPARAPGGLNKWGYLAEQVHGGECDVVGVISKGEERLRDVKTNLAAPTPERPFDTIRGRVNPRHAFARVTTVDASSTVTYRDADTVLALTLREAAAAITQIDRPGSARPGFLTSVAEFMRTTVARARRGQPSGPESMRYVYGDQLYDLRLLEATPLAHFETGGRSFDHVVHARFETGLAGTSGGSRFELVYGTSGPLAEVPVVISYQPRWWLHVELTIES